MEIKNLINLFEIYQDEKSGLYGVRDKLTHLILIEPKYDELKVTEVGNPFIYYFYKENSENSSVASIGNIDFMNLISNFEKKLQKEKYSFFKDVISGRYGIYDNEEERIAMLPIAKRAYLENGKFKFDLNEDTSINIKEKTLSDHRNYGVLNISYQLAFGMKKNKETIIEVLNSYTKPNYKLIDSNTGLRVAKNKHIVSIKKLDNDQLEYSYIKLDEKGR